MSTMPSADNAVISKLRKALSQTSREEQPQQWGAINFHLANALEESTAGDYQENVAEALSRFEECQQVWTRDEYPNQWAQVTSYLAITLGHTSVPDRDRQIALYREVLTVWTPEANPEPYAATQMNLGGTFEARAEDRVSNLQKAIECYRAALSVRSLETNREGWARGHRKVADAFIALAQISSNTHYWREARDSFLKALEVYSKERHSLDWAAIQTSCGLLLIELADDAPELLDEACDRLDGALEVFSQERTQHEWAAAMTNKGLCLLTKASDLVNLDDAIACFDQALAILTRENFPYQWAKNQMNMGDALRKKGKLGALEELDGAVQHYEQAVTVWTKDDHLIEWVRVKHKLAHACYEMTGDKSENIENAIMHFQEALEAISVDEAPEKWALTHLNLAAALQDRLAGSKSDNLEAALISQDRALTVFTRDKYPLTWATLQSNMGSVYQRRIKGNLVDNIEQAIKCYRASLKEDTKASNPNEWAETNMNLGTALRVRILGNRMFNLSDALSCFKASLEVFARGENPQTRQMWAFTQMNRANVSLERIDGNKSKNVEEAIESCEDALTVLTRRTSPHDWALANITISQAYESRLLGERQQNISRSIQYVSTALQIWTRTGAPHDWARAQVALGIATQDKAGEKISNLETAIKHFEEALSVFTLEDTPYDWALVNYNIAAAYLYLFRNSQDKDAIKKALETSKNVLRIYTESANPLQYLTAATLHAELVTASGDPAGAIKAITSASKSLKHAQSLSDAGLLHSRDLAEEGSVLGRLLVSVYVHLGKPTLALESCERSKAAFLLSMISSGTDVVRFLPSSDKLLFEEEVTKLRRVKHFLDGTTGDSEERRALLEEYFKSKSVVDELTETASARRTSLNLRDVSSALTSSELFSILDEDTLTVLFYFAPEYQSLLQGHEEDVLHAFCTFKGQLQVHRREFQNPGDGLLKFTFLDNHMQGESASDRNDRRNRERHFLVEIGKFFRQILDGYKAEGRPKKLMIIPHRGLHKIPFCAVPITKPFPGGGQCDCFPSSKSELLGDIMEEGIWTVPSLSIAARLHEKQTPNSFNDSEVVVVTNPDLDSSKELRETVTNQNFSKPPKCFGFEGREARVVLKQSRPEVLSCDILHVNCHGVFAGGGTPEDAKLCPSEVVSGSGLILSGYDNILRNPVSARDRLLSMVDIWSLRLQKCRLACVVACSGGVVNTLSGSDESLSIGTAFMVGGARNVISALWPVQEVAAVMVMSRFYKLLCEENGQEGSKSMAVCLSSARRWYRDLSEEAHDDALDEIGLYVPIEAVPDWSDYYNWAAFTLFGPP